MALTSDDIDLKLKNVALDELGWTSGIDSSAIKVSVTDGAVTLSGEVRTYPQKLLAVEAVRRVYGVIALIDEIVVAKGVPSPGDADVQQEVADTLKHAVDVPEQVKAAVQQGVITLSGEVLWQHEREASARAVRYLKNVNAIHNMIVVSAHDAVDESG
jgi:VCBS repeat-containing protein